MFWNSFVSADMLERQAIIPHCQI